MISNGEFNPLPQTSRQQQVEARIQELADQHGRRLKSKFPFRLDDEKLIYPFYEKAVKAGIRNVCVHKGLMPADYEKSWAGVWQYNTAWDIGKAAKDWPQLNFIIYHGCLQAFQEPPDRVLAEFEKTGEIKWASDLARIPEQYGVSNVYAEMGTSFAASCTANPRFAAALLGTWIKGMGGRSCDLGD